MAKFYLYINDIQTDYTDKIDGEVLLDERIDLALNSGSINLVCELNRNIEPFTRCVISDGGIDKGYYISSECTRMQNTSRLFYHKCTLIEHTKRLEAFIVGSKAFSYIKAKNGYNANVDRIRILIELMAQKYGFNYTINSSLNTLTSVREYSFGAGATLWDCLQEIMSTENCIPVMHAIDDNTFEFDCFKINDLKNQTIKQIDLIDSYSINQSVDEYCSEIETEMSEVVDRDTITTWIGMASSDESIYTLNNCAVMLDSNIEDVSKFYLYMNDKKYQATKLMLIPKTYIDGIVTSTMVGYSGMLNENTNAKRINIMSKRDNLQPLDFYGDALYNRDVNKYNNLIALLLQLGVKEQSLRNEGSVNLRYQVIDIPNNVSDDVLAQILEYRNNYYLCEVEDYGQYTASGGNSNFQVNNQNIDVTQYVLDEEQWNLLSNKQKPTRLYFKHGDRYIKGFYNTYNSDFWKSKIFEEVKPFIEWYRDNKYEYISMQDEFGAEDVYYTNLLAKSLIKANISVYNDILYYDVLVDRWTGESEAESNFFTPTRNQALRKDSAYFVLKDTDPLSFVYKVEYTPQVPFYGRINKSSNDYKITSRSYNNGASSVDFNQLLPAMHKAVDMMGLPIRTITAKSDLSVGTLTKYGYIVSKQKTYRFVDNELIDSITYNCCDNFEQIASAIGVPTQYEATNLPQLGIVTRFIYSEFLNQDVAYLNQDVLYLALKINNQMVVKPFIRLAKGNEYYLVCQAEDNYSVAKDKKGSKVALDYKNYYMLQDIKYADDDNYQEAYELASIGYLNERNYDIMNALPIVDSANITTLTNNSLFGLIHKDPREHLVFVVKVK